MNKVNVFLLALAVLTGVSASADTPESRLKLYQEEISSRETGVYEGGGDIYVHIRQKMTPRDSLKKAEMKAVLKANELLRDWTIEQTRSAREQSSVRSPGLRIAMKWLDTAFKMWRFSEWSFKGRGQEFSLGRVNGSFVLGQAFSKEEVLRSAPASFTEDASKELVDKYLRALMPKAVQSDRSRTYALLGVMDGLAETERPEGCAREEYDEVGTKICAYLASEDELVKNLRAARDRLRQPTVVVSWSERNPEDESETRQEITVITNQVEAAAVVSNVTRCVQSDDDRLVRGVSCDGKVERSICDAEVEEVVEKKIVTTIVTHRTIRRRRVESLSGNPVFEEVFLSNGCRTPQKTQQTKSGKIAAQHYLQGGVGFDELDRQIGEAIRENPGDNQLWNMYGNCYLKRGRLLAAVICFRTAFRIDNDDAYALANLARSYMLLDCANLSRPLAVLVRGLTDSAWCLKIADEVLLKEEK